METAILQWPHIYIAMGVVLGLIILHLRARGSQVWARNVGMLMLMAAVGGALGWVFAYYSYDYGLPVLMRTALGAWGGSWLALSVLMLWRNNLILGQALDRFFVILLLSLGVSYGIVELMVQGVNAPGVELAYLGVPLIAGGIYRFAVVMLFMRLDIGEREALGRQVDRSLKGWAVEAGSPALKGKLFNPLGARSKRQEKKKAAKAKAQQGKTKKKK